MDPRKVSPEESLGKDPAAAAAAAPDASTKDDQKNAESSAAAAKKQVVKKRTKTGCYTCRRRRIKCDEGKPRCNNCIKSKRQCDGYNQRVIFKDPMGTFQTSQMGMGFQGHPPHGLLDPQSQITPQGIRTASQGSLPFIAPRPPMLSDPTHQLHPQHSQYQPLPMQGLPGGFSEMPPPPMPALNPNAMPYIPPNQPYDHGHPPSFLPEWPLPAGDLTGGLSGGYVADPDFLAPMSYNGESSMQPPAAAPIADAVSAEERAPTATVPVNFQLPRNVRIADVHEEYQRSGPTVVADEEAYWYPDDDASMVDSDDDDLPDEMEHLQSNDLGVIIARRLPNRSLDTFGTQLRTFANFADANLLTNYFPSSSNSPLTDPKTAAVFWYFVNVTGPSMSLFERHPVNPTPVFEGRPVPRSRQHIWTYTFPNIALNHPALLQAMLALGSLHMAKLQGVPATASMKHYHLSLRRIARNYQSSSRRVQPATLAATMLLGFYEVWNSDHDKWCKHMWGARAILKEIPLREMTKDMITLKRNERQRLHMCAPELRASLFENANVAERDIDQVDPQLLAQISGQEVRYLQDGVNLHPYMSHPGLSYTTPKNYTQRDIEIYQMFCDLYWWYCKMDVYQSILGGTRLLMDYKFWTQCCPRAPIGLIDAAYGTYDHLVLLLGRLCHFSVRDQARKRMAKRPDGPPGPPGQGQGQSPPPFIGMMPATGHITIPKGFSPPREDTPESDNQEDLDFEARTAAALREWESIKEAFDLFRTQLGPNFDPLGPEYETPASSPFGMVLKYRTYNVASVWMNYYMGIIILHRCHPSMPHIAMAAAAMSARQTAPYAIEIGRIIAGLTVDDLSTLTKVSTLLGGVSIEGSFPLFVAAVQYQDTIQRHWTVRHLHNVARLTGWQSARQIAIGCETGWTKAASMGRGPPYESPTDVVEVPLTIWNRPKRIIDRIRELEEDDQKLVLSPSERPHYALGLLTVEADLEKLELTDS